MLPKLRPVIVCSVNGVSKTVKANEGIRENEWSEYSFSVGEYVTEAGVLKLSQFRPLGVVTAYTDEEIAENGISFGGTFSGTRYHIDADDCLYISEIYSVRTDCTVTFDASGGTGAPSPAVSVGGVPITIPETKPVKEGFRFVGWSLDKDSFEPVDNSFVPQSDITLFAIYEETGVIIRAKADGKTVVKGVNKGGTIPCGTLEKPSEEFEGYKVALLSTSADAVSGFSADCYSLSASLSDTTVCRASGIRVKYKYVPAENTTTDLTKLLEKKPQINVITGGIGGIEAEENICADEWATAEFDLGKSSKLSGTTEIVLEHIQLRMLSTYASGAADGADNMFGSSPAIHVAPNDKLYLGGVEIIYKYDYEVTFDANGGVCAPDSEYVAAGFGIKLTGAEPQRIGFSFGGWGLTPNAEKSEAVAAGYIPSGNTTLYAIWEYDGNYSLGEPAICEPTPGERRVIAKNQSIYSDDTAVFSDNIPGYLEGREFAYAAKTPKNLLVIEKGRVYILVTDSEDEVQNLVNQGFAKLGSIPANDLSEGISEDYDVMSNYFSITSTVSCGASAIIISDITGPDDSLLPGKIIVKPEEQLEEHPEYEEYLNGNRSFGGCPSITETPDGRLWLSITSGGKGEDMYNYAMLYCSSDGGESWGEPVLVADPKTPVRTSEPLTWCDPDGRLWFFWSQMYTPGKSNSDGRMGVWCIKTDDGGETWSEPKRIAHGFSNQNPIVLSDGTWMLPVNIWNNNNSHPELKELQNPTIYVSNDKGENWTLKGICKVHSNSYFYENAVTELSDGRLWMIMRTVSAGIEETFSSDGGATWSDAVNAGISMTSGRAGLDKLSDGRIIVVSHDDELANGARTYLTVWLSEDGGETFPYKLLLDEVGWYPNTVVCADGSIYITYDRNRGAGGCAMLARVSAEDIRAGKLVTAASFIKWLVQKGNCKTVDKATVSFDTDGGEALSPMTFTASAATNGTQNPEPFAVKVLPKANKSGFSFVGWATEKGGEAVLPAGANYTPQSMTETLYAVYTEEGYDVSLSYKTIRQDGAFENKANLGRIVISNESGVVATLNEPNDIASSVVTLSTRLTSGQYSFVIEKNGYASHSGEFTVSDSALALESISLVPGDIKDSEEDFCGDGVIDIFDLSRILRAFSSDASNSPREILDINEDGAVTVEDIAAVKASLAAVKSE